MKVAVVGATGLVGPKMLKVLEERDFPISELIPVASARSKGKKVVFKGKEYEVVTPEEAIEMRPVLAIFSAGSDASKIYAPKFAKAGCRVVDNSACWRMDPDKKLVIPEINGDVLEKDDMIIANPNCSTIQMLVAIAELHKKYRIKRIVVSTYQCITGTGQKAVDQLIEERKRWNGIEENIIGGDYKCAYPYQIDLNMLPHIDKFLENGYTKEEMKMVNETHKIMRDEQIKVSPTAVRISVLGGHAESINLEFEKPFDDKEVVDILRNTPGVAVIDNVAPSGDEQNPAIGLQSVKEACRIGKNGNKGKIDASAKAAELENLQQLPYPMPLYSEERDEVFVGRIRRDPSLENGLNLWCVADNLRKGAATNAVQIAELLYKKGFIA